MGLTSSGITGEFKMPDKTPELLIVELLHSGKSKTAVKIIVPALMIICLILLLEPVQKSLVSIVIVEDSSLLSLPYTALFILFFTFCCLYSEHISVFLEGAPEKRLINFLAGSAMVFALAHIFYFSYRYGWRNLDSDHASEMILGKLLAEENTLLSSNWHYSTEIRLIYQTIFTMPLFKFFGHYENWALIRSINIVLNNLTLILSYFFMMKQSKIHVKWIMISAIFLIMPLSYEYWNILTFGGYYIFFIAQLFICIGLYAKLTNFTGAAKKVLPDFILFIVLSFALGAQGIRAFYGVYIPLLAASIITKKKAPLFLGCSAFLGCCAGLAVNFLLHFKYSFHSFETMRMENLSNFFSKFGQCLVSLAGFFGLSGGTPILSAQGFFSIVSIIGTFVLFWTLCKRLHRHQLLPLFFAVSVLCNVFVFIISDKNITSRYFIPFMIFYIPLTALLFEHAENSYGYLKRVAIISGIALFIFGKTFLNYQNLALRDINTGRKGYIQYLLDKKLCFGFATFWNANVTTELSNGKIEMATLEPVRGSLGGNPFRIYNYLSKDILSDPSHYTGESFMLLTQSEWDMLRNRSRSAVRQRPDYEDGQFIILRYPSAEVIHRELISSVRQ